MKYKKRVEESIKKQSEKKRKNHPDRYGDDQIIFQLDYPKPEHGDTWGWWKYDAKRKVLILERKSGHWYEISLELCRTRAGVINWLIQLKDKTWMTSANLGNLVMALDDILKLRQLKE